MPRVERRILARKNSQGKPSPVDDVMNEFDDMQGLGALDSIKQAEYWKERALDAINKNKILEERNEQLESDVYAWERRTKRIEKRSERLQAEIELLTKTNGRRKAISNNFEVSAKEVEEVERNPSSELQRLMQSSFRNKWSKKRLAGVQETLHDDDGNSVGAETLAARKYINEYLEKNPQKPTSPIDMVVGKENRSDRSTRSAPDNTSGKSQLKQRV